MNKMTRLVVIFFCIHICASYKRSMREVERFINKWNWDTKCWGETNVIKQRALIQAATKQCMETPGIKVTGQSSDKVPLFPPSPPSPASPASQASPAPVSSSPATPKYQYFSAWSLDFPYKSGHGQREARAVVDTVDDATDISENNVDDAIDISENKLNNLTCILTTIGALDSEFKINRKLFAREVWKEKDNYATENIANPVWRKKMSGMWTDCIDMAESLPQSVIDYNPLLRRMKHLARFSRFASCKKAAEKQMCAAAQAEKLFRKFDKSGIEVFEDEALDVEDKYEKALMMAIDKMESKSLEMEFIDEIFEGEW